MEWKALLFGRLVNNQYIEQPVLHVTRVQAKNEHEDKTPVAQCGWQDAHKGFLQRLYEGMAGDVILLLSNVTWDEVATKTAVSGKLTNPETDTAEAILGLIQNAFFGSILPGLDRELIKNGKA